MKKVLCGWSGGYLDSDEWKLSSGVLEVVEEGDYYLFKNHSGSVYKCHKKSEGMTTLSSSIYNKIEKTCKKEGVSLDIIYKEVQQ